MEAGTGLGEMTKPLARSFISKPKTSGEARAHTHTQTCTELSPEATCTF